MKFRIHHILILIVLAALIIGWYAERRNHAQNKVLWNNEKRHLLEQHQQESLALFDGLVTLDEITSYQNRFNWQHGKQKPSPVNNDDLCSVMIATWKNRDGLSLAINCKANSFNRSLPRPKFSLDTDGEFPLKLAKQILTTAQITDAEEFAQILTNSNPSLLGFTFDNRNSDSEDFESLMEFVRNALKSNRDSHP